jgi:intracellular septation protein A
MARTGLPTALGALSGGIVVLGGILEFLIATVQGLATLKVRTIVGGFVDGIVALVLGLLVLAMTFYAHRGSRDRAVVGGVVLVVLGALVWFLVSSYLIAVLGGVLAFLGGLLFVLEDAFRPPSSSPTSP